jgi:membrane-bound metal-dependent hydrolase YbcI (DUF457 family)
MKFVTHAGFNFFFGLSLGFSPVEAAIVTAGGIFPDLFDRLVSLGSKTLWRTAHRKLSHWPWPYLAGTILLQGPAQIFVFGALLHCVLDALTPTGIPLGHPMGGKWKRGLGLIKTGSYLEFTLIACAFLLWQFGLA